MYKAAPVDLAECCRRANGDTQDASQIEHAFGPAEEPDQGAHRQGSVYEDRPPFMTSERQGLGRPCGIEFGCERKFVLKPPKTLRRWVFRSEFYCARTRDRLPCCRPR